jgi:EmrB/QacA subfamily drug resistance transporter
MKSSTLTKYENKWKKFLIVAIGVFMSTLDSSMVNIALPTIMGEFHSPMADTQWVVLIYLLAITSTLLFWGHLGDRYGRGRVYGCGMMIFALGSLACTISANLALLISSRLFQALGASMMMSTGPAIVKESFPHEQLGRTMGLIGVSVSLGLMSGPSLGGFLVEFFSWRSMFFITVPIGLYFSFQSFRFLPMDRPADGGAIDWNGSVIWAVALCLTSLILTHTTKMNLSMITTTALVLAAAFLIVSFVAIEKKASHPLLPLELFNSRYFSMGIASAILSFTTLFSAIILTPFYLDRLRCLPPSMTGLVMMALPASIMLTSPLAGWLADHFEKRLISTTGLLIATSGIFLLSTLTVDTSLFSIAVRLGLTGAGQALFLSPNSAAVLGNTVTRRSGSVAALLATSRNLGMLIGIALATLFFSVIFASLTGGLDMKDFRGVEYSPQFIKAFRGALQIAATIGIAGVITSWLRGKAPEDFQAEEKFAAGS